METEREFMFPHNFKIPVEMKVLDARLREDQYKPGYGSQFASGMDLRACVDEPTIVYPGETKLIPTGMALYLEDPNLVALLLPRSGLGHKQGIVLGNLVGVIDPDYQGQMMVSCWNRSNQAFTIQPMERIAQMVITIAFQIQPVEVEEFTATDRGEGGFGSTGSA